MTDPHNGGLEARLRRAGSRIDLPEAPDVADRVVAALQNAPARRVPPWWARPTFAAAALVLVLAAATLVFSPTAREAVAGWIGLDGLSIEYDETPDQPLGDDLLLGKETSLSEATATAGFEVAPPTEVGPPDEVYLTAGPDRRVSLVYRARADLPSAPTTRVGLLLSVFRAEIDHDVVTKKAFGTGTNVEPLEVDGARGYWLSGEPHAVFYIGEQGQLREDKGRLAGNTLVWQDGDLIYRLESRLSKDRALEIARSIP